ncbi:MAG: right-handed parallel beta-helix repeat-containing protein [Betaproteobacteria bacterium]|nr:right-handed parallel beta-helix repeat-containing protein [Betaproteobacteria bacterium]
MLRISLAVAALLLSFTATLSAYGAQRTFVSTAGNDANTASNCSNTTPCRGFTAALTVTDSGGEIIVLTSGGYGPVTINKSVSIIAPEGIYAGISVFSGNGITIATAGVDVVLRGLSINGLGGSGSGIHMTAGDGLIVQNCTISNFSSGYGLYVSTSARVRLLDSQVRGNYRGAVFASGATVLVSGSRFLDSTEEGLYAFASGAGVVTKVEVSRSEASSNGQYGFYAYAASSGRVELNVKDSVAARNSSGVYATASTGTALARVSNSLISGNTFYGLRAGGSGAKLLASGNEVSDNDTGLYQSSSAVLQSTGDNTVSDNTTNTSGTITSLANM